MYAAHDELADALGREARRHSLPASAIARDALSRYHFSSTSGREMLAVVDAGPMYATADADDQDHEACRHCDAFQLLP